MANRGLSEHLLAFIRGSVFRRLNRVMAALDGTAFASDPPGIRSAGLWAQIDENRRVLGLLKIRVPDVLARDPSIEEGLAQIDAFLVDLASSAELPNPWALSGVAGFPRPWPGGEVSWEVRSMEQLLPEPGEA